MEFVKLPQEEILYWIFLIKPMMFSFKGVGDVVVWKKLDDSAKVTTE